MVLGAGKEFSISLSNGTNFSLALDSGAPVVHGGVSYELKTSGKDSQIDLVVSGVGGEIVKTVARSGAFGTEACDIFSGTAGNDVIHGNGGRDVAVYDASNWGNDLISQNADGTMTILFNGVKASQVTTELVGDTMTIARKGSSDSITVEGWNSETHNIVYGGGLKNFDKYMKAASPTEAQETSAQNEVWKKAGVLAS